MRSEVHVHIGRARRLMPDPLSVRVLPNGKVFYAGYVSMSKATFSVQPAGLRKFRETGQKNVHAYVRGQVKDFAYNIHDVGLPLRADVLGRGWCEVTYNPEHDDSFMFLNVDGKRYPIAQANFVALIGTKCYAQLL